MGTTIRIPEERQGRTGLGQGGWSCFAFVEAIGQPATVALRSPIPIETDLDVITHDDRWTLVDPADPGTIILEATRWVPDYPKTEPVSVADAEAARAGFNLGEQHHPAPHCLSCGMHERSLNVHPGPLGDGRWATPWRAPAWSLVGGAVDEGLLWMGMDCTCGWYTSMEGDYRQGVTVQFAVSVHETLQPETDYVLVGWNGDYPPGWEGRKRGAAAALFDQDGACVAESRSFWLAPA